MLASYKGDSAGRYFIGLGYNSNAWDSGEGMADNLRKYGCDEAHKIDSLMDTIVANDDLSVRKHWHVPLAGRDTALEVFGAATNLLGRTNLLTYTQDPVTGVRSAVEMRPRAPLVFGLDWRL